MIKNIIFDIGMVLVDFRFVEYMRDLGFSDEDTRFLAKNMMLAPEWNMLDEGASEEEFISLMYKKLPGYEKKIDKVFEDYTDIVRSFSYAKDWILELKSKGYKVYLLSNYPAQMFTVHEKSVFTFINEVDGKIVSGFVKKRKPFREIYELLLETYKLNASECVFIDDKAENVSGAHAVGIHGIVFSNYEETRLKLNEVINNERLN